MPSTSRGYPYPSGSDDVDIPGDMQALADAVNTDVGAIAATTPSAPVLQTLADAAGDLIVASANDTFAKKSLGTDNHVLTVDTSGSGAAKVAWEDPTANPLTVTAMAAKAPLANPTFTGTPAAPTAAVDTNTTQIATTAFIIGQGYAKIATEGWVTPIRTAGGYTAKTALYTATNDDRVINCTSGTYTVTLPTAVSQAGREFVINNSGSGVITVGGAGSETVAGAATQALSGRGRLRIVSDGANWVVLDGSYADETVGRRLFQWDANNSRFQQTFGDTGWRDVTSLVDTSGWTNAPTALAVYVRRTLEHTSMIVNWNPGAGSCSGQGVVTLPSGFGPAASIVAPGGAWQSADAGAYTGGWYWETGTKLNLQSPATSVYLRAIATLPCTAAWPTSLPGTASGSIPA